MNVGVVLLHGIYDILLRCLCITAKESICQCLRLFVIIIIYGELTVSETKCIVNNLRRQLGCGDGRYSLSIETNSVNYKVVLNCSFLQLLVISW